MTTIAIDGLSEEEFRRSIEGGLRRGRAGEAVAKLRELIQPFAGPGRILSERFLTVQVSDLSLKGWENLGDRIRRFDRPGRPVSAISIAFGWPGEEVPQPDAQGRLSPLVEVGYYNDDSFPFSRSGREDLLDGYSFHGCTWGDDCVGSDTALVLEGISDLHGALALLEARLLAEEEPDPDEICAGSLGACLLSALLYQAVCEKVAEAGLPRPLCVMAGSNGVYPYFDAPVAGMPVEVLKAAKAEDEDPTAIDAGIPGPRYSSLLMTGIRRAPKRAVLVLQESDDEMAVRIANLRGLAHGHPETVPQPEVPPAAEGDGIVASPISPLKTRTPANQDWDFRDMLSPRNPAPPSDNSDRNLAEPQAEQPEAPQQEQENAPEPGFSLVDDSVQQPLQSLLIETNEESPISPAIPAAGLAGPVWPLGIGWLESAEEADSADELLPAEEPQPETQSRVSSLWARLRAMLARLRRSPPANRRRGIRP